MIGTKHLIQCHCMLPQFKKRDEPLFHKFVVYSKCDNDGEAIEKFSKCNNCGVIHKIIDFCKSELFYGSEDTLSLITVEDLRLTLHENIQIILDNHKCDISTWEQVAHHFECDIFDTPIVIAKKRIAGSTQMKHLILLESGKIKIDVYLRRDEIESGGNNEEVR